MSVLILSLAYLSLSTSFKELTPSPYEDCLYAAEIGRSAAEARDSAVPLPDYELHIMRSLPIQFQAPALKLGTAVYDSNDGPIKVYRRLITRCTKEAQ